jgi:hypothetical protein
LSSDQFALSWDSLRACIYTECKKKFIKVLTGVFYSKNCTKLQEDHNFFDENHRITKAIMKVGFICPAVPGRFNPMSALARQLQARSHDVVMFSLSAAELPARAADLPFVPFGEKEFGC